MDQRTASEVAHVRIHPAADCMVLWPACVGNNPRMSGPAHFKPLWFRVHL